MEIKATDRPTSSQRGLSFDIRVNEPAPADNVQADALPAAPAPEMTAAAASPESYQKQELLTGVVTDCMNLNLRAAASGDAKVLVVIPALTEVVVDMDASTDAFYKVCTAAGVEGFCMKKYVALLH